MTDPKLTAQYKRLKAQAKLKPTAQLPRHAVKSWR